MKPHLTGAHRRTYDAVFQHPLARNLDWRDVRSMLRAIGGVAREHNGNLKIARNGQTLVLHPSSNKNVASVEELMEVRHFLERSESTLAPPAAEGAHLLVVIDHREARIYKTELHGAVPDRITPHDPGGFGRHLHFVQDDANGQRRPERNSFYAEVAARLRGAQKVLVFGSGTGASSAMDHLLTELRRLHPELADRVIGTVVVDEAHLTDDQLLARARDFYSTVAP
jgi:hypothetical protein